MSGHSAVRGDRFTEVEGARSSTQSGAKAQYYPTSPPDNATYNPTRPPTYNLSNLPRRNQVEYWNTLTKIHEAGSKRALAVISRNTGVARIPLCVSSPTFLHPSYFPLDPFHLFYENCMPFIWDTWATGSKPGERVHVPSAKISALGELIGKAYKTLPPSFCGTIRDPALKRQSQYKAYEWMALLHWYILPIGLELEFDFLLLDNFSYFVHAVETAMTVQAHSQKSLAALQETINTFLQQYETLYVGSDPTKILRCRLCVFQLVHVPIHISWYGSIRNGSQATVEREIGHAEHQIHSKAHPFANLENILVEKETIRLLQLYIPDLSSSWAKEGTFASLGPHRDLKLIQSLRVNQADIPGLEIHFRAIRKLFEMQLGRDLVGKHGLRRYGKLQMKKHTLRSRVSEVHAGRKLDSYNLVRDYRWFEVSSMAILERSVNKSNATRNRPDIVKHQFAEALAFYSLSFTGHEKMVVVYKPLEEVNSPLRTVIRGKWPSAEDKPFAIEVSCISNLVGIWEADDKERSGNVYILRKHPGLEMLDPTQCGLSDRMEKEMDETDE
ncbi:hypothetical protein DFP72DRAFT_820943 [Ephemerocybe angulata]|uniref:Uncharacterized protein n=1 Tax=Ephemerocybe angulata TaxID=980116 RepID=A0A8H6HLP6_9AGAR|nr:hypothetical protein DFP72DRAFT_820943 [Tulosesus angulatus]